MVSEIKASSNFMLDAAIVELASEAVLYEVCKCGSLRGWNRIDASMNCKCLKVHAQIGVFNMAAACAANDVCILGFMSAATPQGLGNARCWYTKIFSECGDASKLSITACDCTTCSLRAILISVVCIHT